EEETVIGHGKVNARRSQDGLAEKAERGDSDGSGNERRAALAQCQAHDGGGGGSCCRERLGAERAQAHPVHAEVQHHYAENSKQKSARQVFLWLLHFRRKEVGRLPSSISE